MTVSPGLYPSGLRRKSSPGVVEISGVTIDGKMLDYLIQHYLIPQFPEAKVGQPFELAHHIDHLEVKPEAVGVVLGQ